MTTTEAGELWEAAVAAYRAGDLAAAASALTRMVQAEPAHAEAWALLGEVSGRAGAHGEAVAAMRRAALLRADDAAMHRRLGDALLAAGEAEGAVSAYRAATTLEPANARGFNNLGRALHASGARREALDAYAEALRLKPDYGIAHHNAALVLVVEGRDGEALAHWRQALGLAPQLAEAWSESAATLARLGDAAQALVHAERALTLRRPFVDAERSRAIALAQLRRPEEALVAFNAVLAELPGDDQALYGRARLCDGMGDRDGAIAGFRSALAASPDFEAARWSLAVVSIPALPSTAAEAERSREAFSRAMDDLEAHWSVDRPVESVTAVAVSLPFYLTYQATNNRALLGRHGQLVARLMARWWSAGHVETPVERASARSAPRDTRPRIAIVSAYLYDHSVYQALIRGWLRHIDRQRFRVDVFGVGPRRDAATAEAEALADSYTGGVRDLAHWVQAIRDAQPDAIVYPELGMDTTTYRLAALRLAPLQAVSWGHPDTSGLPTVDAYLSATAFESDEADGFYSEALVRLPGIGCHYEPSPPAAASLPPGRLADTVEFLCAGTPFKYAPEHDRVFPAIARRVGRCRFHFFRDSPLSDRLLVRIGNAFRAEGLAPEPYLVLHPWATPAEFSGWLQGADIMLDTLGFSGFNTVMQALGHGLPVVTLRGRFLRGRLGSGILESIGADELVAADADAYVELAVALACDLPRRRALRTGLGARVAGLYGDLGPVRAIEGWLEGALGERRREI